MVLPRLCAHCRYVKRFIYTASIEDAERQKMRTYRRMHSRRVRLLSRRTPRLTEYSVTDDRELLIAAMAREAAHHHQCALATARRQIRSLVAAVRAEYRAAGCPTVTTIRASVTLCSRARA